MDAINKRLEISPEMYSLLAKSKDYILCKDNYIYATTKTTLIKKHDIISSCGWFKLLNGPKKIHNTVFIYGNTATPLYESDTVSIAYYPLSNPPRELNLNVLFNNSNYSHTIINANKLIKLIKEIKNKNNSKLQISISDRGFILLSFFDEPSNPSAALLGASRFTPCDIEARIMEGCE